MRREATTVYFESAGQANTDETVKLAGARARELGIKKVVVASNTGTTALKAAEHCEGCQLIVVTHSEGFREPNTQELVPENKEKLAKLGARFYTGTHVMGGISRAARDMLKTQVLGDFMAITLKMFGQGTKVAIEISMMAADAGLVRTDEEVVAIGGTGKGADTALVIKPAYAHQAFSLKVAEIICKPRL
ncbi:MAG: pyruvate kinase alpha/beta domain-containing protein [Chloroflexota bacterium]